MNVPDSGIDVTTLKVIVKDPSTLFYAGLYVKVTPLVFGLTKKLNS